MKYKQLIIAVIMILIQLNLIGQEWKVDDVVVYEKFDDLEEIFYQNNDTIQLINFWATWCGPCVKELPYIEELHEKEFNFPLKITLVSLDFAKKIDTKLIPFLNKKEIKSEVVLLNDSKTNQWIDKVDPSWSGSIPIIVIYKGDQRFFFEQEFHSTQELVEIIQKIK